jgi:hypothetical protein
MPQNEKKKDAITPAKRTNERVYHPQNFLNLFGIREQ